MFQKIVQALYLTNVNALSLFQEAHILEENKKFARAYTLYHLSFEECGRFILLFEVFTDYLLGKIHPRDLTYKELKNRGYEDHNKKIIKCIEGIKNNLIVFLKISQEQANTNEKSSKIQQEIEKIQNFYDKGIFQDKRLNELKNQGLYVVYKKDKFILPDSSDSFTVKEFINIQNLAKLGLDTIHQISDFAESKGGFENFKNELDKEK